MAEITKHWSYEPVYVQHIQDNYQLTLGELDANRSDIAICSIWQRLNLYQRYDCSTYFDHICGTFLVPKPVIKNSASNALFAYSMWLWISVLLSIALAAVCLTIVTKVAQNQNLCFSGSNRMIYDSWGRSLMEVFAISTTQSIRTARHIWAIKCILIALVFDGLIIHKCYF